MRQRAEITFETEETVVLRNSGKFLRAYCPLCRDDVYMLPPETISAITGTSEREIFRLIETADIHFAETDRLMVCSGCYLRSVVGSGVNQSTRRLLTITDHML